MLIAGDRAEEDPEHDAAHQRRQGGGDARADRGELSHGPQGRGGFFRFSQMARLLLKSEATRFRMVQRSRPAKDIFFSCGFAHGLSNQVGAFLWHGLLAQAGRTPKWGVRFPFAFPVQTTPKKAGPSLNLLGVAGVQLAKVKARESEGSLWLPLHARDMSTCPPFFQGYKPFCPFALSASGVFPGSCLIPTPRFHQQQVHWLVSTRPLRQWTWRWSSRTVAIDPVLPGAGRRVPLFFPLFHFFLTG